MTFRGLGIWDLGIIGLGFVNLGDEADLDSEQSDNGLRNGRQRQRRTGQAWKERGPGFVGTQ